MQTNYVISQNHECFTCVVSNISVTEVHSGEVCVARQGHVWQGSMWIRYFSFNEYVCASVSVCMCMSVCKRLCV